MAKQREARGPANVVGAAVRGSDFWGRADDVAQVWRRLERGSVLLTAPRRHGKSSLMHALADAPRDGWTVEYFDVEYVQTPRELLVELTAAVLSHDRLRTVLDKVTQAPGQLARWLGGIVTDVGLARDKVGELKIALRDGLGEAPSWAELTEQLLTLLDHADGHVLLIVDEFPMMVGNFLDRDQRDAIHFLKWFRAVRQRRGGDRLRFLLGGSVNIEPRLELLGQQALLADLERFPLRPLERGDAEAFVAAVLEAEDARHEIGVAAEIVRVADCGVPFFLQVLISEAMAEARRQRRGLLVPDIEPISRTACWGRATARASVTTTRASRSTTDRWRSRRGSSSTRWCSISR